MNYTVVHPYKEGCKGYSFLFGSTCTSPLNQSVCMDSPALILDQECIQALTRLSIFVDEINHFIICIPCETLLENNIRRHLREIHKKLLNKDEAGVINQVLGWVRPVSASQYGQPPAEFNLPKLNYLPVFDGLKCNRCFVCFCSERKMQMHCCKCGGVPYAVKVQSTNKRRNLRLFSVSDSIVQSNSTTLFNFVSFKENVGTIINQELAQRVVSEKMSMIYSPLMHSTGAVNDIRDISHWLVKLRWYELIDNLPYAKDAIVELCASYKSNDETFGVVNRSCLVYLEHVHKHLFNSTNYTVLKWINSTCSSGAMSTSAWTRLTDKTSIQKYSLMFSRLLCMLIKLFYRSDSCIVPLKLEIEAFLDAPNNDTFHQLAMKIWFRNIGYDNDSEINDPVYRFLVFSTLKIDGSFMDARTVTAIISKLQFWARAVVVTELSRSEGRLQELLYFLKEGHFTPFNSIRQIMHFATHIAYEEGANMNISWVNGADYKSIVINGQIVSIDSLRIAARRELNNAKIILDDLTAPLQDLYVILDFFDDLNCQNNGYSFMNDPRNSTRLFGHEKLLLNHILSFFLLPSPSSSSSSSLSSSSLSTSSSIPSSFNSRQEGIINWNLEAMHQYMSKCAEYLEHLFMLIHLSSGMPARATELSTYKIINTELDKRGIYATMNTIMLLTSYWKGRNITDNSKNICRYLPKSVAQILSRYLILVRPVEAFCASIIFNEASVKTYKTFLFVAHGKRLEGSLLRTIFRKRFMKLTRLQIGFMEYRHIAQGFANKLLVERSQAFFDHLDDEYAIYDEQAGHSSAIASRHYSRSVEEDTRQLSRNNRYKALCASTAWHKLIHLNDGENLNDTITNNMTTRSSSDNNMNMNSANNTTIIRVFPATFDEPKYNTSINSCPLTGSNIDACKMVLVGLRKLFGEAANFKSTQQAIAMVLVYERKQDILAILPTGAGKTLLYAVPALLEHHKITIVIIPTIALTQDAKNRCIAMGIDCIIWTRDLQLTNAISSAIIFVAVENVGHAEFVSFASRLEIENRLSRIVMDECHLSITWGETFRLLFKKFLILRQIPVPLVMLTATLPPHMEESLKIALSTHPTIIRAPTTRKNIKYATVEVKTDLDQAIIDAVNATSNFDAEDRIIIYCMTIANVERLYMLLAPNASRYHSEVESLAERNRQYARWKIGQTKIMVATSAFAFGIDYAHVRLVIHRGGSANLLDYAQESGRAGRDNKEAKAVIYKDAMPLPFGGSDYNSEELERMKEYIESKTVCKKQLLYGYLDSKYGKMDISQCCLISGGIPCDICADTAASIPQGPQTMATGYYCGASSYEIMAQQAQARHQNIQNIEDEFYLLLNVHSNKCVICMSMPRHELRLCPILWGRCLYCMSANHTVKNCKAPRPTYPRGGCIRCGLPSQIGEHVYHEVGNYGRTCSSIANDRLVPLAWYIWCNYRVRLVEKFPELSVLDDEKYVEWFCQHDHLSIPKTAYIFTWWFTAKVNMNTSINANANANIHN